jgi:hypothetical protein
VRKRRHRRGTVTVAAVTAAVGLLAVFFAVIVHPGPDRVVTTGPGPASATPRGKPVTLPGVAHPKDWTALDIGRLRLYVPADWETNAGPPDCDDNDGDLVTLSQTTPPRSCTPNPSVFLTVRTAAVPTPSGTRSRLHGLTIWTSHKDAQGIIIAIPALHSTLTAQGTEALRIARSLGPSSLQAVLSMTRPIAVPARWKPVRYHGIQIDVPPAWKTATVPYDCGTLFMGTPTAYTGPAREVAGCAILTGNDLYQPHDGVWLQPVPRNAPQPHRYQLNYNQAQINIEPGVNSDGGFPNVPNTYLTIHTPTTTITATLGLGPDPLTAERILSSIRALNNH